MAHFQPTAATGNNNRSQIGLDKSVKGDDLDWFHCFIDPSLLSKPVVGAKNADASATISPISIANHPYPSPPISTSVSPPVASTSASGAATPAISSAATILPQTSPPPPYSLATGRNNKRQRQQGQAHQITRDKKQKTPGFNDITRSTVPRSFQRPGPTLSSLRAANQTLSGFVGAKYSGSINSRSGGVSLKTTTSNVHQTYLPLHDPAKDIQQPDPHSHQTHHHHCCHHSCTLDSSPFFTVAAQDEINHLKAKVEKLEGMVRELSAKISSSQA